MLCSIGEAASLGAVCSSFAAVGMSGLMRFSWSNEGIAARDMIGKRASPSYDAFSRQRIPVKRSRGRTMVRDHSQAQHALGWRSETSARGDLVRCSGTDTLVKQSAPSAAVSEPPCNGSETFSKLRPCTRGVCSSRRSVRRECSSHPMAETYNR